VATRPDCVATVEVDLDGLENQAFWKDYWDNGLVGTALYYLPHLAAMPERAGAALTAVITARHGGVLFHCMGGRDRTGMIAMLLLAAADVEPDDIVEDYLETVRLGDLRAASANRNNDEEELEQLCRSRGTTTAGAMRTAVTSLDLEQMLRGSGISTEVRVGLMNWRGSIVEDRRHAPAWTSHDGGATI
jgi:protein-tyrosine phosphatase